MKKIVSHIFLFVLFAAPLFVQAQDPLKWEESIQKYEKRDQANPPEEGTNLFVGSSSIAIWQDIQDYFPDHDVLNRGFGGSQFSDIIHYADRIIYPYKPAKIFIYEGDNDLWAGEKLNDIVAEARQLREMIAEQLPGIPVAFISPKPSAARWDKKKQYEKLNRKLRKYTEKTANTEFVDIWCPSLDENGNVFTHIFLEDDLHMNAEGYKIWQEQIAPYLVK